MAAGLGFKDFTTGEVLTAADVDGYLMQGVWVFASAAARDAAVTSPQEGNFAYLKDTNVTTYYTGSAWANLDTTGMTNPMTTTGDTIYSSSGSTPARLGIGTAGQVLTVNAGATAPEWKTVSSGSTFVGCVIKSASDLTVSNNTTTIVDWTTEVIDTDGFHDNSTNPSRITIPTGKGGKYLITFFGPWAANATGARAIALLKNGGANTPSTNWEGFGSSANATTMTWTCIAEYVAGDYIQARVYQTSGGNLSFQRSEGFFSVQYLGA